MRHDGKTWSLCIILILTWCTGSLTPIPLVGAQDVPRESTHEIQDFTQLSLEELMNVEVTSVSKKKQKLSSVSSAIFVLTQEDLRRSGMTSIPEALRLVPGLNVARLTANKWSISSRGFNGQYANKLLILIDGRSVYTPLFAGVYWDVQDVLLEDIDRIEVIRGPGGTIWGANAVNGIINIITKTAVETQGTMVVAGGGNLEQGFGAVRYGGKVGDDLAFRVYGKYFNRDNFSLSSGRSAVDEWNQGRLGFRSDWNPSLDNAFTIQGDVYDGRSDQQIATTTIVPAASSSVFDTAKVRGGNVLTRWSHLFSSSSELTIQVYYDRTQRREVTIDIDRDTFDFDLHHNFSLGDSHEMQWGLGYRYSRDVIGNTFTIALDPKRFELQIFNGFIQDTFTLIPEKLRVIAGTKVSSNSYSGLEYQPNGRVIWNPHSQHTLWGAVSRAVRLPSRIERDGRANVAATPGMPFPTVISITSSNKFKPEEVLAYELGYRSVPSSTVSIDIATFYNVYRHLLTTESQTPFLEATPTPTHLVVPSQFQNRMNGNSYGVEIATKWNITQDWSVTGNYTWQRLRLRPDASSANVTASNATGNDPKHQFQVRSTYNLPYNVEFDSGVYFVSRLPNLGVQSYARVDARLGWNPTDSIELSLVGQNLFDNQHPEFSGGSGVGGGSIGGVSASEVPRGGYLKVIGRF